MIIKLIGKKQYYSLFYLQKIRQKHIRLAGTSNIFEVESGDNLEVIKSKLLTENIFAEKKLVVVREAEKIIDKNIIEYLAQNNSSSTTVVLQFSNLNQTSQKYIDSLNDSEEIVTINTDKLTPNQIIDDILIYKQDKVTINKLIELSRTNELEFFNQLKKLSSLKEFKTEFIALDKNNNNFLLVENLLNNPLKYAFDFYSLIDANSLQSIVGLLLWQLKVIIIVKHQNDIKANDTIKELEAIIKTTKISDYSANKAKRFKLNKPQAIELFIEISTINSQYLSGLLTAKMSAIQIISIIYDIINE